MSTPAQRDAATISLDDLIIETPCPMDWELMEGDQQRRFCSRCDKHVYNIAEMTEREALRLIGQEGASVCARLYRRPDGTVVTSPCSVPGRKATGRRLQFSIATLVGLLTSSAAVFASAPWIGRKLEPFVLRWFGPDPAPVNSMTFTTVGMLAISPDGGVCDQELLMAIDDLLAVEDPPHLAADESVDIDMKIPLIDLGSDSLE